SQNKLPEFAIFVAFFWAFVHLLTSHGAYLWNVIVSGMMTLAAVVLVFSPLLRGKQDSRRIWAVLSALAGGFWVFNLFRYVGLVEWPLSHPVDLAAYLRLLYSHFVLTVTVLAPVLIACQAAGAVRVISWGNWKRGIPARPGKTILVLVSAGCWFWAVWVVLSTKLDLPGPFAAFVTICLLKAFLTGATEEICYRGIIQPSAIARFGIPLGIIMQSCLYTVFHIHLGEAFFSRVGFLAGVMVLGLVFGLVTHFTHGIGWAVVVHIAINVVIEWSNLS
ncbi:MAG: CPBP family intramembrane glutamic endopeptidase, partial [Planctomycetota bacterium]